MHITLIGMSNIGKTRLSRHLAAKHGFDHVDCDARIERRIGPELSEKGFFGTGGMARWMGFPFDPQYAKNSAQYLACERAVLSAALDDLHGERAIPSVIDTTGSVIYAGDEILEDLRATTRIVYLEASEDHFDLLFKNYIAHPKPVIWGESFAPQPNEAPQDALRRCYPDLLRDRAARYRKLAHIVIPYLQHRNRKQDVWDMMMEQVSNA